MNEKFVPFVDAEKQSGKVAYEPWWRETVWPWLRKNLKASIPNPTGNDRNDMLFTMTAGGKPVEGSRGTGSIWDKYNSGRGTPLRDILLARLEAFARLPEADRKPVIEDPKADDKISLNYVKKGNDYRIAPPPNGIILTSYRRFLNRDDQGRYSRLEKPTSQYKVTQFGKTFSPIAGHNMADHPFVFWMWISEQEAKALLPTEPKQGSRVELPQSLRLRLITFYLNVDQGVPFGHVQGQTVVNSWSPDDIESENMSLQVEEASPQEFRMRLTGKARLVQWAPQGPKTYPEQTAVPETYQRRALEARLEGVVVYDRQAQKFTRFDIVALGGAWGSSFVPSITWGKDDNHFLSYQPLPIAFTFELDMSDYEKGKGFWRGRPTWHMILGDAKSYWHPELKSKKYQPPQQLYTYPE